jgi:hypothetical protein
MNTNEEALPSLPPVLACGTTPKSAALALAGVTWPGLRLTVTATHLSGDGGFKVFGRVSGPLLGFNVEIHGVAVPGGFVVTRWE